MRSKRLLQLGFLSHAALFGEELRGHVLAVATLSYGQPRSVVLMGGYVMEATACLAALTLNLFLQAQDIASMLAASVPGRFRHSGMLRSATSCWRGSGVRIGRFVGPTKGSAGASQLRSRVWRLPCCGQIWTPKHPSP